MDVLQDKSQDDLIKSLLEEAAKASSELKCAQADIRKAQNRLSFILVLTNLMINRQGD